MMWEFLISNQKKPEGMSSILLHLPNKKKNSSIHDSDVTKPTWTIGYAD